MEDLSMFQRPRTVALEDENPGTYGMVLIYPHNRLVSVASWVTQLLILGLASSVDARVSPERMRTLGLMEGVDLPTRPIGRVWLRGTPFARIHNLFGFRYDDLSLSFSRTQGNPKLTLFATPRTASYQMAPLPGS
ncbi:hypothetical protein PIB30_075204 [Stylosanthes scabra]|uniref:Uncharacterized protein n=1 Tax=Stylosanthes scabra TaxID=79078 RepID=A0ABU6QPM5_9FABA|nr:hypothetical protein [Stylosanthes scabra]